MKINKLTYLFGVLFVSACASHYGNITPLGNSTYQIVSKGDTKEIATSQALKGAKAKCKNFVVSSKTEKYVGVFSSEQIHMQNKRARDSFLKGSKAISGFAGSQVASKADSMTEEYFKDAFETSIDFSCK